VNIVADHCASIDATRLSLRLPEEGLPPELKPICTRLNDLLSRLNSAFTRERRFTADAAHELRTPIAELRSIAEVALKWPDDSESCVRGLRDALDIAEQMETLVTTLLSLARSGDQEARVVLQPVFLHDVVAQCVRVLEKPIGSRAVEIDVPADAFVMAEPSLLTSVLTNLLANAGEYARGDAAIRCIATRRAGGWTFSIENPCAKLEGEDLGHLFEPFWRRDHSRTDGGHAGLGLALVAAYCRLMHVQCEAMQPKPDALRITLHFAAAAAAANRLVPAMS
jgi:two-component system sensor histidine kinase QseC